MSSLLIKHQEKYLKQAEALQEPQSMMQWVLRQDSSTALKVRSKNANKLYIPSLFMKLMSLTLDLKDFWLYFLELQDK